MSGEENLASGFISNGDKGAEISGADGNEVLPDKEAELDNDFDFVLNKASAAPVGRGVFPQISKLLEDAGSTVFDDPDYYKKVMAGGSDQAKRLHAMYQKYATAKDPKDKGVFRQQLVNIYWDFYSSVAAKAAETLPDPKKFLLRFAMLNPNALTAETRSFFSRIQVDSRLGQSVHYLDEWFSQIGKGELKASTTDEIVVKSKKSTAHLRSVYEKALGQLEGTTGYIKTLNIRRTELEGQLKAAVSALTVQNPSLKIKDVAEPYTNEQKDSINVIQDALKQLSINNRELGNQFVSYDDFNEAVASAKAHLDAEAGAEAAAIDLSAISTEFESVRQMAKMTIGRQGNAFPFLSGDYFHSAPDNVGFKENIIKKLAWIESIDKDVFDRTYRTRSSRIVPHVILLPTYGDYGICWEPYEKLNKTSSKGRIAIPMYPKNLTIAVLTGIADFRWQLAKENASFYWMDEGLTGNYYQWFQLQKLKGDLKQFFIKDYILWMTKEAEGIQALDKNVRGIFWRYMPFAQELKETLKMRNLVYQELYQRDQNRAMSDGY